MFKVGLLIGALALSGCVSTTPADNAVRLVGSQQAIDGCQYLANVQGNQNMMGGMLLAGAAYKDALNQMKRKTVDAGGNTLFIVTASTGMTGANAIGDAYRC